MIIQILNTINDDIKQIRTDVFMKEQGLKMNLMKLMKSQNLYFYL